MHWTHITGTRRGSMIVVLARHRSEEAAAERARELQCGKARDAEPFALHFHGREPIIGEQLRSMMVRDRIIAVRRAGHVALMGDGSYRWYHRGMWMRNPPRIVRANQRPCDFCEKRLECSAERRRKKTPCLSYRMGEALDTSRKVAK